MPSPSHPSRSAGRLGIKTSIFMDNTNNITSQINRFKKGSCDIYLEENNITQPEIRQTTLLKLRLTASKIRVKVMLQDLKEIIVHSTRSDTSFITK